MIKLIKASAGSGKTYQIQQEFLSAIEQGIPASKIIATTFTVKAANELKNKVRKTLLKHGKTEAAEQVLHGWIGTVNGICERLLLDGDGQEYTLIPEDCTDEIFRIAAADVLDQFALDNFDLLTRMNINPVKKNEYNTDWKDIVKQIVDSARANGITLDQQKKSAEKSIELAKRIFTGTRSLSLDDVQSRAKENISLSNAWLNCKETPLHAVAIKFFQALSEFYLNPIWSKLCSIAMVSISSRTSNPRKADSADRDFTQEEIDRYNACRTDAYKVKQNLACSSQDLLASQQLQQDVCNTIQGLFDVAAEAMKCYSDYKTQRHLIDFVDQESLLREKLASDQAFNKKQKNEFQLILVDEFQDTSPIQLDLFLRLNAIIGNSIWVGDVKQSIYAFRGTSPDLVRAILGSNLISPENSILQYSWRSMEKLIKFSNNMFSHVFEGENVTLDLPKRGEEDGQMKPEEWDKKHDKGDILGWKIAGNEDQYMVTLAKAVNQLIQDGTPAKDIAVLLDANAKCAKLSAELAKLNIPSAAPAGKLVDADEIQLIMAAYRYAINRGDTTALATYAALRYPGINILEELSKDKTLSRFQQDFDCLGDQEKLKEKESKDPLQFLNKVVIQLQLDRHLQQMQDPDRRFRNLEALRKLCDTCKNVNSATGRKDSFISYFMSCDADAAAGINCDCVQVMTYHKSKGLEWPVVILASLDHEFKPQVFGVIQQADGSINPEQPLSNRWIRFIPTPFAENATTIFENNQAYKDYGIQTEEFKRLMYVGVTRAKEKLIFAFGCSRRNNPQITAKWLEQLEMHPAENEDGSQAQIGEQTIPQAKPKTWGEPQQTILLIDFVTDDVFPVAPLQNTQALEPSDITQTVRQAPATLPEQNVPRAEASVQDIQPRGETLPVADQKEIQRALHSLKLWTDRPQEKCARIIQYIVNQTNYTGQIEWDALLEWVQTEYPEVNAEGTIRSMMNGNGHNYGKILERVGRGGPVRIRPELQNFVRKNRKRHTER